MIESAFDDYLVQWRAASPQRAIAWLFLRRDERRCFGALAALEQEWLKAVREVREPQVVAAKLGWWREEVQHSLHGQASHPLTKELFADARANAVPLAYWIAPVDAAIATFTAAPPADFAAQRDTARPLADALAELETRVWFGAGIDARRAARTALFAHLVSNTRVLEAETARGRSPLPMNLLARHGLTLDGLGSDGPARRAALHDYTVDLERELVDVARMSGSLSLFRAVGLQHDLAALARAARADDPLSALRTQAPGFNDALKTWRAARTWRGTTRSETRS